MTDHEDPNVDIDFTALRSKWGLNDASWSNQQALPLLIVAGLKIVDEKLDRVLVLLHDNEPF